MVVERLHDLGMADARSAVDRAAASGASLELVNGLIDHYERSPGAWGLGALHYRIRQAAAGQAVDSLWPPPAASTAKRNGDDNESIYSKIRFLAFREGRQRGLSHDEIEAVIVRECERRNLTIPESVG